MKESGDVKESIHEENKNRKYKKRANKFHLLSLNYLTMVVYGVQKNLGQFLMAESNLKKLRQ